MYRTINFERYSTNRRRQRFSYTNKYIQAMKLLKLGLLIAAGILCLYRSHAQYAHFVVADPQWGRAESPTLEEASITLRPVGLYTEIGLYFTVSARNTSFQKGQQLEAVLTFALPENSIINDSWLWVDTTIIRAKILDRWTASTIYENIVNRRKDPSILLKNGRNSYTLRIYPLIMGENRRVKINYLVPGQWSTTEVLSTLPAHIIGSNQRPTPAINIRAFFDDPWQNPLLPSHPEVPFAKKTDPILGSFYEATIPPKNLEGRDLSFSLKAPLRNGLFLSRFGDDKQGYYQMALFPDQLLAFTQSLQPKRIMVLVHHAQGNAINLSAVQVLEKIRGQLKRALRPQDYFNVILAGINPQAISKNWISASSTKVDSVFQELSKTNISSFNLPGLLAEGIETIVASGAQDARVLLFANSVTEGNLETSNDLIKELSALKGNHDIPFYIVDYAQRNITQYGINNRSFLGNEYFYLNWSRLTKGDYAQLYICCTSFEQVSNKVLDLVLSEDGALDIHTSLQNGFNYNRYNLNLGENEEFKDLRKPILQVGRYQGKWPFVVELSGSYGNNLFFDGVTVPLNETVETDSIGADSWAGNYIANLEQRGSNNNSQIAEIIRISIRERVLSNYTAFLCLEPCLNCQDQTQGPTVSTRDLQDSLVLSKISPNPFRERVMIQLKFKELMDLSKAQVAIYNHLGQIVRTFQELPQTKIQDLELQWDGANGAGQEVPAGVYIFRLQTGSGQLSRKLVKLER